MRHCFRALSELTERIHSVILKTWFGKPCKKNSTCGFSTNTNSEKTY